MEKSKLAERSPEKVKFLLVEDNPGDIDLMREALSEFSDQVELSVEMDGENASEKLTRLSRTRPSELPDVVFLDLNVPRKDGREVLAEMKRDLVLRSIPVVILTSSEASPDVLRAYESGVDAYLVKPTSFSGYREIAKAIGLLAPRELGEAIRKTGDELQKYVRLPKTVEFTRIDVLLLEDNRADADWVKLQLESIREIQFAVHSCESLADAVRILGSEERVDVILADLNLPDSHGLETIEALRKVSPRTPVVVLSGDEERATALTALKSGAQEFIVKGQISSALLPRTLLYALKRKERELDQLQSLARDHAALAEAENALRLRDEFLSIASHELRTPIAALKLQIELVSRLLSQPSRSEVSTNRINELLSKAGSQIDRFNTLMKNLFEQARARGEEIHLQKKEMSLSALARDVVHAMSSELQQAGCTVKFDSPKEVHGEWDRVRLEQVLVNLLSNARKYAPGSLVGVSVSERGGFAIIEVWDRGKGISPEAQKRIFDKFARGEIDSAVSGSGLGLYIVRQIVEAHGGQVRVESQPGQGSRFVVELPNLSTPV